MSTSSRALRCATRHTTRNPPAELSRLRIRPRQATYPLLGKLRIRLSSGDRPQQYPQRTPVLDKRLPLPAVPPSAHNRRDERDSLRTGGPETCVCPIKGAHSERRSCTSLCHQVGATRDPPTSASLQPCPPSARTGGRHPYQTSGRSRPSGAAPSSRTRHALRRRSTSSRSGARTAKGVVRRPAAGRSGSAHCDHAHGRGGTIALGLRLGRCHRKSNSAADAAGLHP